jgi:hypothetical protein
MSAAARTSLNPGVRENATTNKRCLLSLIHIARGGIPASSGARILTPEVGC